jgi:hypothetical protein
MMARFDTTEAAEDVLRRAGFIDCGDHVWVTENPVEHSKVEAQKNTGAKTLWNWKSE